MSEIKNQIVKNSASNILQIIAAFISGLILPPVLISKLGLETYGVWGLIVLLNQYSVMFDLGLQTGLIKLSSEYATKDDVERVNRLFSATFTIYIIAIIFSSTALILLKNPAMQIFFGNTITYKNLFDIALLYALASLFNLLTFPFSALLKGLQRYDLSNLIDIIFLIINALISIILVLSDFGLSGLVYGYSIALVIKLILLISLAKKIFPVLRIEPVSLKLLQELKHLFRYAPADLSVKIFSATTQTLIRFSLKNYAGISFVGMYDIAKRLVNQVLGISSSIFTPFLPAMTALAVKARRDEISFILNKASLYLNLFILPSVFYLLLFFEPILKLWLNLPDVSAIRFAASVLLISTMVDLFTGPITTSAVGFGVIRLQIIKITVSGIILSSLVIFMGYFFSFKGIVISELITNLIALIFSTLFFDKLFKYTYTSYLLKSFFDISKIALPVIFSFYLMWILLIERTQSNFIIFAIISVILSSIIILKMLFSFNIISQSEIKMVKDAFFKKRERN